MNIYEKVKRFDPVTGKPIEKLAFKEIRCDYTGEVLEHDSYYWTYDLNYGDMDPCFGSSGDEYKLGKDFNIDMFPFLSQTYHFLSVAGTDQKEETAEWQMMEEALKNCRKEKSEWHRCYTFDAMCRTARVRTA
jgi:hypothetical protein